MLTRDASARVRRRLSAAIAASRDGDMRGRYCMMRRRSGRYRHNFSDRLHRVTSLERYVALGHLASKTLHTLAELPWKVDFTGVNVTETAI